MVQDATIRGRSPAVSTAEESSNVAFHEDAPEPLRFERRQSDRWPIGGVATAFELAGEHFGRMHTLRPADYSHHGMGAIADDVIQPGSLVSIGFQEPGYTAKRGTVVRCLPCGDGYRVGIVFEQRLAA
jgi:hypothetical protein